MHFDGTFEIEDVSAEEVWVALSDPYMIKSALPGCQFLVEVEEDDVDFDALREELEDEEDPPLLPEADPEDVDARGFREGHRYATLVELGVGSVKPSFRTVVSIDHREFPKMEASAEGDASNSAFEMDSWMQLTETDGGVAVEWGTDADVFGRVAQMGQRVINPVANRVVKRFFNNVADRIRDVSEEDESSGLRDRIRSLV